MSSSSSSPFIMHCELSGEPLSTSSTASSGSGDAIVVTPSGHVCRKSLLLAKLLENGGIDPFDMTKKRPLSEDDLIALASSSSSANSGSMPPKAHPLGSSTTSNNNSTSLLSFSSTVGRLQSEYDAVLLELFDTRQALQETRRELSQALYQNDAAVRVVARLTAERNAARAAQTTMSGQVVVEEASSNKKRKIQDSSATKDDTSSSESLLWNDIPQKDMASMQEAWQSLHQSRKSMQKQAANKAPTKEDLKDAFSTSTLAWNKKNGGSGGGIVDMAASSSGSHDLVAVLDSSKSNTVSVYSVQDQKVLVKLPTTKGGGRPTAMAMTESKVCRAYANGTVQVYTLSDDDKTSVVSSSECTIPSKNEQEQQEVVDVRFHPDGQHVVVALKDGMVAILSYSTQEENLSVVSMFDSKNTTTKYTCACLHPDGLIHLVGCDTGEIYVWDFQSKTLLAQPLKTNDDNANAVQQVTMSPNGYHIAALYASGQVRIWDLRKQTVLATLNEERSDKDWLPAQCVTFDAAGKYVAYGVSSSTQGSKSKSAAAAATVHVVAVKEWKDIAATFTLENASPITGLVWTNPQSLVACSSSSSGNKKKNNHLVLIGKDSMKEK